LAKKNCFPEVSMQRDYPDRPLVGIGVIVLRQDPDTVRVLLVKRGKPPAQGAWSLPGGAQRLGETMEQAARRELAEETGLTVGTLHLAAAVDSIHRDGEGGVQYHYTIVDFAALHVSGEATAGGDAAAVLWAREADFTGMDLWPEARRAIDAARRVLAL
jgi:ADP-ribose pyrophosphatase YjhB (NUDIX family)